MDVSGLVITSLSLCFEVTSTLYSYGKQVKGARRDIQNLSNEVFGLIGALEHLKLHQEQHAMEASNTPPAYSETEVAAATSTHDIKDKPHRETFVTVLKQTLEFLQELQESLGEPKSRLRAAAQLMKWPLREGEVQKHLTRLERVKTFFVLSLVTDEANESRKMANEIAALRTLIQDATLRQQAAESRSEHQAMIQWLCPVDPYNTRKSVSKTRMAGTGAWFTDNKEFRKQLDSKESSCLWLKGITGAGKTTLITAAINELLISHEGRHDLAYFYCSFSNVDSQNIHNVLGSLLSQICFESDSVYHNLRTKHRKAVETTFTQAASLDIDTLVGLIAEQARFKGRICLVVDAINESSDPHGLLKALKDIITSATGVQLVVASIDEKNIERGISSMPKVYEVAVSPKAIENDVSLLVHSALRTDQRLRQLPKDLQDGIARRLTDGAEGMFRWVQCQLDLLSRLRTPGAVEKALKSLPPTLDKTYESLLDRIEGEEDRQLTRQILKYLAFSFRPLSPGELDVMLQVTPKMRQLDESKGLLHPTEILDICGSLIKYNDKAGGLTLAHHSVKTYLTSNPRNRASFFRIDEKEAHRALTLTCLTYLSLDVFSGEQDYASSVHKRFPFLDYATQHWALHMKEVTDTNEPLWSTLRSFLLSAEEGRNNFANWVQLLLPTSRNAKTTLPLYYAASYGLTTVVKYLIDIGTDLEARGGRGGATPINIAAFRGNLEVVKLLHEHGADPLKPDLGSGLSAVEWAKINRHSQVVDYFEKQGYGKWLAAVERSGFAPRLDYAAIKDWQQG